MTMVRGCDKIFPAKKPPMKIPGEKKILPEMLLHIHACMMRMLLKVCCLSIEAIQLQARLKDQLRIRSRAERYIDDGLNVNSAFVLLLPFCKILLRKSGN